MATLAEITEKKCIKERRILLCQREKRPDAATVLEHADSVSAVFDNLTAIAR